MLEFARFSLLALLLVGATLIQPVCAQDSSELRLRPQDTVRIMAFQNPELQVESLVASDGSIAYPLAGTVIIGGLTLAAAKQKLVQMLRLNGVDIDGSQLALELVRAPPQAPVNVAGDPARHTIRPGDAIRVEVFKNPELDVRTRVAEDGTINYPLAGQVSVNGLTLLAAKQKLVQMLKLNGVNIDDRSVALELVMEPAQLAQGASEGEKGDYRLGPGDAVRVSVFQNPDLSLESRISDSGTITYPLVGVVSLGGLSVVGAEQKLSRLLKDGGFVADPQLSITLLQVRGSQVSLLGLVNKPGRYPLEQAKMRLTDVLALGGGVVQGAADSIVLVGTRNGKPMRRIIDVASMILRGGPEEDVAIQNGDILYVNKAPVFYILGEVQRPGSYRIERDMTLMQALATGGGITQRGTLRGISVHRRDEGTGRGAKVELDMQDRILPDDVISVRESWF